jgi:hypothetical protein
LDEGVRGVAIGFDAGGDDFAFVGAGLFRWRTHGNGTPEDGRLVEGFDVVDFEGNVFDAVAMSVEMVVDFIQESLLLLGDFA